MGLSYELISEFVKITNDKKEQSKEGIVYATVVNSSDGKYVRIDGSDLLTPAETTADIDDGERVTVMIKDHKATVTGNITNPSASNSSVKDVSDSVTSISDRVGTFELIVAEKISVEELEAYKITVNELIADKASITDLNAVNATIENLKVKDAEIENLVADKATIEDLEAVNATIENLKVKDAEIENAVIENLEATTADIKILNADFAQIKTLVNGNLTSDNILSFNITADKVTMEDAFIKDAMIANISAGKINAGTINTSSVSIGSEDGGMIITGSTQQFKDKNGNVRIQIGKDASGDFTFILYGEDGTGQILNQNGITATAIGDGLIVNSMVSDTAAISGGKLDISSVITEINSNTSTTINSSKVYIDSEGQSLEVAFSSLKTQVDNIEEITISGDLSAIVEQVKSNTTQINANKESINTLISEDTIIKTQISDLNDDLISTETELSSKYTSLNQSLEGFKTTVADTYATKSTVNDLSSNLSTNYSTTSVMNSAINQKANEITASVSATYATKTELTDLNTNLTNNYYTILQTDSAISVAKEEINLNVSSIYETKENTTSKINSAVTNIKIGGTNLINKKTDLIYGYISTSDGNVYNSGSLNDNQDFYTTNYIFVKKGVPITFTSYPKQDVTSTIQNAVYIHFYNTDKVWKWCSEKVTEANTIATKTYVAEEDCYVRFSSRGFNDYNHMAEFASKPSEWSPSPEDVDTLIGTKANSSDVYTKSEVYTKSQTDSAISVAKDEINLEVSSTYETKTNVETKITTVNNTINDMRVSGVNRALKTGKSSTITLNNTSNQTWSPYFIANDVSGKKVIIAFDYVATNIVKSDNSVSKFQSEFTDTSGNSQWYPSYVFTLPDGDSSGTIVSTLITFGDLKSGTQAQFRFRFDYISGTFEISKARVFIGDKDLGWLPAPEDVDTAIDTAKQNAIDTANSTLNTTIANYYTKSQTDSAISVAKEEINLSVSNVITETKTTLQNNIDGIKIGGTNLFNKKTDLMYGYISESDGNVYNSGSLNDNQDFYTTNYIFVKEGTPITFTSYPKQDVTSTIQNAVYIHFYNTDKVWKWCSKKVTEANTIATKTYVAEEDCYVRFSSRGFNDYNHMAEFANKPSEWSPSPGDVDSSITYIETETKSLKENIAALEINTNSINASVSSLEETVASNIDGLSQDIKIIQNQVNATMTAEDVKLEIQNSMANGVSKVTTSTGFTFNEKGLKIDKSDSEMSTQITEDGMTVYKNDEAMLTANNEGVEAKNLHATTYLIIGENSRMEDFTCDGRACTAVFWIGPTS